MTAILYGNLRVEIVSNAGARVQRVSLTQAAPNQLRPSQPRALGKPLMLGREQEAADALAAVKAGRWTGFFATCGYGKTTLLQNIMAAASEGGIASRCIYLRAGGNRIEDLLQDLVDELFVCDRRVKLTPQDCAQVLGQVRAVVAVDDLLAGPDQIDYLHRVLPGCRLVIGSAQPVLDGHGSSHQLGKLPEEAALSVLASGLGRPLAAEERASARRLVEAVDGQPLHLRQCAALAREGRHSLRSLSRQATSDPEVLDRLSINALAQHERRALAVLALAAGTLLPATVVEAMAQVTYVAEWLESLHRRGLAEHREDRFGLPVCKAESYRQLLIRDLHLAASARGLSSWLTSADPTGAESQSAAEAALAMMGFAAERGDWTTVVRLAGAAERVLFIAGRWEAWQHALSRGLDAARMSGDRAAEAFFAHQQGTLAFCQDRLDDADQLLQRALTLRMQIGDAAGADVTRHNLRLLEPPDPPSPPPSRVRRHLTRALRGVLGTLALVVSTVVITGVLRSSPPAESQPTGPASVPVTHSAGPVPSSSHPSSSIPGHQGQPSGSIKSPLRLTPSTLTVMAVGVRYSQQITVTGGIAPYTFTVSGTLPPGLSLSSAGVISGTPETTGSYPFTITATDGPTATDSGSQPYTAQVNPRGFKIILSPATLAVTTVGVLYSQQVTATGGMAPYTFTVSGTLPPGLSLSTAGVISGTPETTGSYPFTITATDARTPTDSGSQSYTLQVNPRKVKMSLSPTILPSLIVDHPEKQQITATGGTAPYSFTVTSGTLPAGLTLSSAGVISGTPTTIKSYQFTITATDALTPADSGWQTYTVEILD